MANIKEKRVFALGFFDSIHIGHRYLLKKAEALAKENNALLTIFTFNDHFLPNLGRKDKEVYLLEERIHLLESLGYDDVFVVNPTKTFLKMTAQEFLNYLLSLNPIGIVAGSDYTFGQNGSGNMAIMQDFMKDKGVIVKKVDLQKFKNNKVSTTSIKKLLNKGDIEQANLLLGDKYFVTGTVIKGRGDGTKYGFPTANIAFNNIKQLPLEGLYKTSTEIDGKIYKSLTNVGIHPTFDDNNFNIETLILDFSNNIYDKHIKVMFYTRIRGIIRFNSPQELGEQIKKDIEFASRE